MYCTYYLPLSMSKVSDVCDKLLESDSIINNSVLNPETTSRVWSSWGIYKLVFNCSGVVREMRMPVHLQRTKPTDVHIKISKLCVTSVHVENHNNGNVYFSRLIAYHRTISFCFVVQPSSSIQELELMDALSAMLQFVSLCNKSKVCLENES